MRWPSLQFFKETGHSHMTYKSDQETSLGAHFEEAFQKSSRQGALHNPRLQQLVLEASSARESQSNGRAENAVQRLEDMVRTFKSALEMNIGSRISSSSAILKWMVKHAASALNRQLCNAHGQTPYEALHGQRFHGKAVECGEQIFYFVPKRLRSKLNLRWRFGTIMGNAQSTNECFVAAANEDIVKTRSVVKVIAPQRWSKTAIEKIRGPAYVSS